MRIVIFCHSLVSDWNHGNAHFLRGVVSELIAQGHSVSVWEPEDAWSMRRLLAERGPGAIERFHQAYPELTSQRYNLETLDVDAALGGADLILVHEWNDPALVRRIGEHHDRSRCGVLLFHDTHHRSLTDPESMARYDLRHYDGVLAFGQSVADVYRRRGWATRVWTWHEAADVRRFRPLAAEKTGDLVWIGNWGDDERSAELREFLIEPARDLSLKARLYGVRYPASALRELASASIGYAGWTPNFEAPRIFASYRATVHIPRRPYANALPGIPTIRVFEALACGIPLVSAPWDDCEHLFHPGEDYMVARDGKAMRDCLRMLLEEPAVASALAQRGLATLLARHTCAHRVEELLEIARQAAAQPALASGGQAI